MAYPIRAPQPLAQRPLSFREIELEGGDVARDLDHAQPLLGCAEALLQLLAIGLRGMHGG